MISGVVTEIYKDLRGIAVEKRLASKAEIENSSHRYDEEYKKRHGQINVFCVGMREPVPLDDVYVAVQFLDDRRILEYGSPEEAEEAFRQRARGRFILSSDERQDGTEVANEKQYLMLLGGPGVGKSTFLRKVGLEALKGKKGKFAHKCIPVFLELKRFTEEQISIETLITDEFRVCGFPHPEQLVQKALESGKLLVLFDGLDEVPRANLDNVIRKIGDFVNQYSQNRFIASCRVAAYKGGFRLFTVVEMADFEDSQIKGYIDNWFASTPDRYRRQLDEEMKTAEQCWKELNAIGHQSTKELARSPLLLTLLCMVYDNLQSFPRNRADLYEKALSIFLEEWAAEKRVRREELISQYLDIADEKRMLSEIAAKNFEENRLFFSQDELIDQIQQFGEGDANTPSAFNAPKILETILVDQGLFVERVSGSYSFSHLTFQEYLTANYIVKDTRSIQGLVKTHLHDDQWREVFLLTAGRMHAADELLVEMETEAAKTINTDRLKALFRWAEQITDSSDDRYNKVAKRTFVIYQFFSLRLLNKIHEVVTSNVNLDRKLTFDFNLYPNVVYSFDFNLYQNLYQNFNSDLYRHLNRNLYLYLKRNPNLYSKQDPNLYQNLYQNLDLNRNLYLGMYQDFHCYMNTDFYRLVSSEFGDRFDKELEERITFVRNMEQKKIFKRVNLQRIVRRFNAQRKFIRASREGKSVDSPKESIHDTWLSVLRVTDDMLAISREEMANYVQYLQTVNLIIECKEAAGRVSPEVWADIEKRFLTLNAMKVGRTSVAKSN